MQPDRVVHPAGVLAREFTVERPVRRLRADGDHRLQPGRPGAVEHPRQFAPPREGVEMRVRVNQAGHE